MCSGLFSISSFHVSFTSAFEGLEFHKSTAGMIIPRGNPPVSRKSFPASQARGEEGEGPAAVPGGPQALVGGSGAFKGTLGKQLRRGEGDECWKPGTLSHGGGWLRWPCPGTAASEGWAHGWCWLREETEGDALW